MKKENELILKHLLNLDKTDRAFQLVLIIAGKAGNKEISNDQVSMVITYNNLLDFGDEAFTELYTEIIEDMELCRNFISNSYH